MNSGKMKGMNEWREIMINYKKLKESINEELLAAIGIIIGITWFIGLMVYVVDGVYWGHVRLFITATPITYLWYKLFTAEEGK